VPMAEHSGRLAADDMARARALAAWKQRITAEWPRVSVRASKPNKTNGLSVGDPISATASISLSGLSDQDVAVELCMGRIDVTGQLTDARPFPMEPAAEHANGTQTFESANLTCESSGLVGYTVRVRPAHIDLAPNWQPPLLTWAEAGSGAPDT
jgi:starch phosphorylase